jgi:glycosyltransferase involved in cell wall biosynthesis
MDNLMVSFICTLKNEGTSVAEFLDTLLLQSRPPDEIIIVDGGSTDATLTIIEDYIKRGAPIKLIVEPGANIARGRNIAIKTASHDIIASTDAGCRVDKRWLENLVRPFEERPDVEVVSGWYEPDARTKFEEYAAWLMFPALETVKKHADRFLPSSRSVAYKKKAWERAGGYPEWLYTAEDTLFDLNLKKAGCKFSFAGDAVVFWRVRPTLAKYAKAIYLYARGDGQAGLFPGRVVYLDMVYAAGLALLLAGLVWQWAWLLLAVGILVYLLRPTIPAFRKLRGARVAAIVPALLLTRDVARMSGYAVGLAQGRHRRKVGRR